MGKSGSPFMKFRSDLATGNQVGYVQKKLKENPMKTREGKKEFDTDTLKKQKPGYQVVPLSMNRRMMAATLDIARQQNNIQAIVEVDISEPRRIIKEHRQVTGESLSFSAYVVTCLAGAITEYPQMNAFRKGRKLILLDNVTISVLVERELEGEMMPENLGIRFAQQKTLRQIHTEIRSAQEHAEDGLGGLSGTTWVRFIPSFLLRTFVRLASRNISMMDRFGAVGVTAVGMYARKNEALWLLPMVGGATVAVAVGGIVERPCIVEGRLESREHLCLTVTFNHEIVDGAPAARFLKSFSTRLSSGDLLRGEVDNE
jgi:pyruvate/2-oxoglutarate dehydrogenase complex dihydrolipoamide acyltransferase (E2) component